MDYFDDEFFQKLVLPPIDCLWGWLVPLQPDERVDIVYHVKTIFV
jgi:hypothetical protein